MQRADSGHPCRLKYLTARSCFSAADRVLNVPRFLRFPVFGSFFCEYSLNCPDLSFLIIFVTSQILEKSINDRARIIPVSKMCGIAFAHLFFSTASTASLTKNRQHGAFNSNNKR